MRKATALLISFATLLACGSMPAYAAQEYSVAVPFVFDHLVVSVQSGLVMTEGTDNENRGYVYTTDGVRVQTEANDAEFLENDYIKIKPKGSVKWTIYRGDGTRAFTQTFDFISVTNHNIAFVADGSWHPPGYFIGKFGAINLLTGSTLISPAYDELQLSVDGKYLWAKNYESHGIQYRAFDLNGNEVTDTVGYVAVYSYDNGYYKVQSPKTGLYGLCDTNGKLCVPAQYNDLGNRVLSGSVLVQKGNKWGASSIDGSGKLLQSIEYNTAACYSGDIYALKKWGSILDDEDPNTISVYYGDGSVAFSGSPYNAIYGVCGDVIYVSRKVDNALVGLSKTGEVIVSPVARGYLSFVLDDCDFVLIGRRRIDGFADPTGSMVVNRWGQVIAPFDTGNLLSDGIVGRGLSLYNNNTNRTIRFMADGFRLSKSDISSSVDYKRGWIIYNDNDDAWITDLLGNILVPKGIYRRLDATSYSVISGQVVQDRPNVLAQDKNGKYGALSLNPTPYVFTAHDWAKQDITDAVSKDLVPQNQQRDWRDACTRGDFCKLLAPLLKKANVKSTSTTSFTDTQDADILLAASLGIVTGVGSGKFAPNRPISRQQAAVILSRTASVLGITPKGTARTFSDRGTFPDWAKEAVASVTSIICGDSDERVMQGVSGNRFLPQGCYTREQSMLTILRMYRAFLRK